MSNLEKIREIQIAKAAADEKLYSKLKKDQLKAEVEKHYRIVDLKGASKWELIAMIMDAKYGAKVLRAIGWD